MIFKRLLLISFFSLLIFSFLTSCKEEQKESESFLNNIKEKIIGHKEEVPPSTLEKIQDGASQIAQKIQEIPHVIKESVIGSQEDKEKSTLEKTQEVIIDAAGQIKEKIDEVTTTVSNMATTVQQKYEENAPKTTYENIREMINTKLT